MGLARLVAIVTLLTGAPAALHAQHALVSLPLDDPAYVQFDALDRMGCRAARISAYRPYAVGAVRTAILAAAAEGRCNGSILESLRARFHPDTAPVLEIDTVGVAPDLAAATVATTQPRRRVRFAGVGAALTLRATALSKRDFRPLWKGVQDADTATPPLVAIGRVRGTAEGGPNVVAVIEAYAQTSRRNDPLIRQRAFRNTSGAVDFSEAYLTGRLGIATFSLGRMGEAWLGEGRESLALSANGPPLDRISAAVNWKRLEGRAIVTTLNDVLIELTRDSLQGGPERQNYRRALYGHALTYRSPGSFEFTLGETVLASRTSAIFDLGYANPLMPYVVTQNDTARFGTDTRDNLQVFAGTRYRLGTVRLTGELMVDDIQIDAKDRETVADQLGYRFEAVTPLPTLRPASAGIEYRHIDSYTYLKGVYTDVYQHYDQPLGSELGPDADMIRGSGEMWISGTTRVAVGIGYWRQGALRIFQRPSQRATGNGGKPYPTTSPERPGVQRALLTDLSIQLLRTSTPVTLRFESARIENANNQPLLPKFSVRAQLYGTYAFRYP